MKINSSIKPIEFKGEDDDEKIVIRRSNMGEPYRDGIDFDITRGDSYSSCFLEAREVRRMRDLLSEYLNDGK